MFRFSMFMVFIFYRMCDCHVAISFRNEKAAWRLHQMFKKREVVKKYWVITKGVPNPTEGNTQHSSFFFTPIPSMQRSHRSPKVFTVLEFNFSIRVPLNVLEFH